MNHFLKTSVQQSSRRLLLRILKYYTIQLKENERNFSLMYVWIIYKLKS